MLYYLKYNMLTELIIYIYKRFQTFTNSFTNLYSL